MGVITKNERSFELKSSISEETLYIPSSDDERSEISVAERHARSRVLSGRRVPTVGPSTGSLKPQSGKKKSRRYQNVNNLMTLAEEDELTEVTIDDFVDTSKTGFFRLLEDDNSLEKWEAFVNCSEETQQQMIDGNNNNNGPPKQQKNNCRFSNQLRSLLKKRNLPIGMVQYLEGELVQFFLTMPRDTYISPKLSSFERMLLHSLSEYHSLLSMSFNREPRNERLVRVKNPKTDFTSPELLLTEYLESMYNNNK